MRFRLLLLLALMFGATGAFADDATSPGSTFSTSDTLNAAPDPSADANACLAGLVWSPSQFQVHYEEPRERCGDVLIRYPSPISTGDTTNDLVAMEWYMARNEAKLPITAPAVVVVHESGSGMTVGRMFARGLRMQGFHAFMIQLPYYGERRANGKRPTGENLVPVIRQAIADVRRARDAVAALPHVDATNISLQGTSLGGFVCATSASLDGCYDHVFITLAGGGLADVLQSGEKDAAKFRESLAVAGLTGDKLKSAVSAIEPTRIAHRLDPATTWLYSAQFDKVVPPFSSKLLATTAKLDSSHHIQMLANHYSGVIFVPYLLTHMQQQIEPAKVDHESLPDGD